MLKPEDVVKELFAQTDDFVHDTNTRLDMLNKLVKMDFLGIAIGATGRTLTLSRLPLLLAHKTTDWHAYEVDFQRNCILAATSMDNGRTYFGLAILPPEGMIPVPRRALAPRPKPSTGVRSKYSKIHKIDARKCIPDLPWRTGALAFTVILYDWISNTVQVKNALPQDITTPRGAIMRELGELFVNRRGLSEPQQESSGPVFPEVAETGGLPSYEKLPSSPPLPEHGVTFTFPSQHPVTTQPFTLYGSLRKPVRAFEIVERSSGSSPLPVAAIIPVTAVVITNDETVIQSYRWKVPVYSDSSISPGDVVEAYFAIPFTDQANRPLRTGTHYVRIIVDGMFSEAQPLVLN